jgi:heme oxygenase (mycobilin-producing)
VSEKARVIFLLELKPGTSEQFLEAYERIRHVVAGGVKGHVVDQVCQAADDPDRWVITSEWETLGDFAAWEATDEHRELIAPMRRCFADARSLRYLIRRETTRDLDPTRA